MHVLVDPEVQFDFGAGDGGDSCCLFRRGQSDEVQGPKFLDPVAAARLAQIGFPASFHLDADPACFENAPRYCGDVGPFSSRLLRQPDGITLDQFLRAGSMQDHLRKRNLPVGAEGNLERGIPAGGLAVKLSRADDLQKLGKRLRQSFSPLISAAVRLAKLAVAGALADTCAEFWKNGLRCGCADERFASREVEGGITRLADPGLAYCSQYFAF